MKKLIVIGLILVMLLVPWLLVGCGVTQEKYDAMVAERDAALAKLESVWERLPQTIVFESYVKVIPSEALNLIQENQGNPDFVIIDAQPPEEFARRHIDNAINMYFGSETIDNELDKLDKNKKYLVYGS